MYSATYLEEPVEEDRRYRVMVLLARSDRPSHVNFKCYKCGAKVAELMNTEAIALTDVIDSSNIETVGMGVRCDGRDFEGTGKRCSIWYYFHLGGAL